MGTVKVIVQNVKRNFEIAPVFAYLPGVGTTLLQFHMSDPLIQALMIFQCCEACVPCTLVFIL